MTLSPVILFVYNRPGHTQRTLEALRNNYLAEETVLYIYSDGPKHNASKEQKEKINEVRNIIRLKQWCKEVHIVESDRNKGLADSIIAGVTEIINRHGRVIVLEDDIITSRGFLRYMNEALNIYQDEEQVMHVSAYIYPHKYKTENETLFLKILSCWGWGTWARAWKYYNHSLEDHLKHFSTIDEIRKFNIHGHADYYRQLELNYNNSAYTWAVRWYASWLYAGGITLFPKTSLVENIGFDKSGENCLRPVNHFSTPVAEYIKVGKLDSISENLQVRKDIDNFYKRIQPRKLRTKVSSLAQFLKVYSLFRNAKRIISLIKNILSESTNWQIIISRAEESSFGRDVKILPTYQIYKSIIEDYSYVARNSNILNTHIGRFCSIGPNFVSGLGIHPIDGISTAPMFYSNLKQNGITLTGKQKVEEFLPVKIGNDVFIGSNVTLLSGIIIGDGAVVGAGAVVSKDIPPYAVVVGNPAKIIKYRFSEDRVDALLRIRWWDLPKEKLAEVERLLFDIDSFIKIFDV